GLRGEDEEAMLANDVAQVSVGHLDFDVVQGLEVIESVRILLPAFGLALFLAELVEGGFEVCLKAGVEGIDLLAREPAEDDDFAGLVAGAAVDVVVVGGE